jgi:hypothetical protein
MIVVNRPHADFEKEQAAIDASAVAERAAAAVA